MTQECARWRMGFEPMDGRGIGNSDHPAVYPRLAIDHSANAIQTLTW